MPSVRVNATADGDNTIVAAPGAGRRLVVYGLVLTGQTTAGVALLRSGAAGTIHGDFSLGTSGGVSLSATIEFGPMIVCDTNAALILNNSAGLDVRGIVVYGDLAV
jgi:hypothetical protein